MDSVKMREAVEAGKTILGIEFGSTRIKAVLTNEENTPIAQGAHDWENRLENGIWTYTLEDMEWIAGCICKAGSRRQVTVRCQPEKNWCNRIFSNDARLHGI